MEKPTDICFARDVSSITEKRVESGVCLNLYEYALRVNMSTS